MKSKTVWYLHLHVMDEWKCVSSGSLAHIKKAQSMYIQNGVTTPLRVEHSKLISANN
jgi:hypothetical protein